MAHYDVIQYFAANGSLMRSHVSEVMFQRFEDYGRGGLSLLNKDTRRGREREKLGFSSPLSTTMRDLCNASDICFDDGYLATPAQLQKQDLTVS